MWLKQCHVYHPWLGMVEIPSIYDHDLGMVDGIVSLTLEIENGSSFYSTSGKHTKNYGKSPCSMGKSTMNGHFQ